MGGGREPFVCAADTRNPFRFRETWSGPLRDSLFGLAPDGVFRAALLALRAVRSYRTFSPLPVPQSGTGGLIFCGTVRRKVFQPSARVYPGRTSPGYVASRPLVFGLSSPGSRRKRFSALPKPMINLAAKCMAGKQGLKAINPRFAFTLHPLKQELQL